MANWNRKKVFRLAKGFTGRSNNCFGLALRKVFKKLTYAYRDRKVKKRLMRRQWIHSINAAVREHGVSYSRFQCGLSRSNVQLDRKILADLALTEPYSFKAVVEEVNKQTDLVAMMKAAPKYVKMAGLSYLQAMESGFLREGRITKEQALEIERQLIEPQAQIYGLRNIPGETKEAREKRDYMRLEKVEEDEAFLADQQRKTLTLKEMKKRPREVL
jgi:large subunit ribosomal protein L20